MFGKMLNKANEHVKHDTKAVKTLQMLTSTADAYLLFRPPPASFSYSTSFLHLFELMAWVGIDGFC